MTIQSEIVDDSAKKLASTLKTLDNTPHSKLAPKATENKLESKPKAASGSKTKKENKGIPSKTEFVHKPTISSVKIQQNVNSSKTRTETKRPGQASEDKKSVTSQKNRNLPKSPLQAPKSETEKLPSTSQNSQDLADNSQSLLQTSPPIKDEEPPTTIPVTQVHETNSLTPSSAINTTPFLIEEVQPKQETVPTVKQDISQQLSERSAPIETAAPKKVEGGLPKLQSPLVETPSLRNTEDVVPKMNRPKGRRVESRIVLKPPPEDWPQPEAVHGAKQVPLAPEFTGDMPPMGTYVDSGKRKSGYKAESFVSPPYMSHVKIDLMPAPERAAAVSRDGNETTAPPAKWRIRGRKDRPTAGGMQTGGFQSDGYKSGGYQSGGFQSGGFQRRGISVSLTMKPSNTQFFFGDNITYVTPTVRSARPFRTYINFRQRGPMNVGRLFGPAPPPPPPFPQPQPPPQHFHNPPFNQAPFPQHPQFPHPPFPPFPRGPPPPPRFGPPPPHPRFGQPRPYPHPFAPPFPQGPPPPPPHFQRGPPPPPPQYGPPFPPPTPPGPAPIPPSDLPPPPPPPPSPYPTGVVFPTVRPFYENIPTISAIDNVPAPWPRRQVYMGTFQPKTFVPRNFSAYRGPRRGRAYEQFGKADLRPKRVRFFGDDLAPRGTPKTSFRHGSGYGVEFQSDMTMTRPPYVPGPMFVRRTWPTRGNRFGYEPYRRSSDRKRPFGGFGRFGEKPPVLGDFGQFKPYRKLDFEGKSVYNFSRPTRSYTFPPRLQMAIRNATYQRRSFRRFDRERFDRRSLGYIPSGTYKSYGLGDNIAHDHDHYGNLITRKGRIMNLQDLKRLFTYAPVETAPVLEPVEAIAAVPEVESIAAAPDVDKITATPDVESIAAAPEVEAIAAPPDVEPIAAAPDVESIAAQPVLTGLESATAATLEGKQSITVATVLKAMRRYTLAPVVESFDSDIVTVLPEETVNKLMEEFMRGKPESKPVGMTAKEALRAAAREAIRDTEMEAYDRGETIGGGLGRRKKGGFRPRGERGRGRGRGRGAGRGGGGRGGFRFGTGARNFRRAKRSVDEVDDVLERQERVRRDLRLHDLRLNVLRLHSDGGDYLTGPGASSGSSSDGGGSKTRRYPPLRMRRFHTWRGKGRPLRWR